MSREIGDELYKVRKGKKIGYYKLQIVDIVTNDLGISFCWYIIKGRSKETRFTLINSDALSSNGYTRNTYFNTKIEFLKHFEDKDVEDYVKEELVASKRKEAEKWI